MKNEIGIEEPEKQLSPSVLKISCGVFKKNQVTREKADVYFDIVGDKLCICYNIHTLEQIIIDKDIAKAILQRIAGDWKEEMKELIIGVFNSVVNSSQE